VIKKFEVVDLTDKDFEGVDLNELERIQMEVSNKFETIIKK